MAELAASKEQSDVAIGKVQPHSDPLWARLTMPSVADLVFLVIFCTLVFTAWSNRMLGDAGTGWHIRNGEHILATHAVPHADYFSYTAAGRPWFAWEWLYDVVIAAIHSVAGLNGTVVFTALIVALVFALLFRVAFAWSHNLFVSVALTFLSAACSSIHFLARPHVLTWLFTLLWIVALRSIQGGRSKAAYWLPIMMIVWVNLHGGFIIGLMLTCIFVVANVWTYATASCPTRRANARSLAAGFGGATVVSALVTLVNPYGFKLWTHLYEYLGSRFLMDNIAEFQAPNFHWLQMKFFAALLLLSLVALALQAGKVRAVDLLLVVFAAYAGLYAARNVPISAIILTLTIAPMAAKTLSDLREQKGLSLAARRFSTSLDSFTSRMNSVEQRLVGHVLPVAAVLIAVFASLHGGRIGSAQAISAHFDDRHMPVAAVDYLAAHGIRSHVFCPDDWGGYLVYRMYPSVGVFMDDRHDFYGESFLREYLQVANAGPNWRAVLNRHSVNWVLIPADSPLASVLDLSPEWTPLYSDNSARVFGRVVAQ
jgi:hypothetical protein